MSNFYFLDGQLSTTQNFRNIVIYLDFEDTKDVLRALELSVEKWKLLLAEKKKNPDELFHGGGSETCALCRIDTYSCDNQNGTKCPIFEFSGEGGCPQVYYDAIEELDSWGSYEKTEVMYKFMLVVLDWYKRE